MRAPVGWAVALAASTASCSSPQPNHALEVAYRGCSLFSSPGTCPVREGATLWVWTPEPAVTVTLGGVPIDVEWTARDGGWAATLPAATGRLRLSKARFRPWSIALAPEPDLAAVRAVREARAEGDVEREASLRARCAEEGPWEVRAQCGWSLALRTDTEEGWVTLRRAAEAESDLHLSAMASLQLAYHLFQHQRWKPALSTLEDAREMMAGTVPHTPHLLTYTLESYTGSAYQVAGDHRRAMRHFSVAARQAGRLDDTAELMEAARLLADSRARMGQGARALALLLGERERALSTTQDSCERGLVHLSLAWTLILHPQARPGARPLAHHHNAQALDRLRSSGCRSSGAAAGTWQAHAHLNEAILAVGEGDVDRASRALREVREARADFRNPWLPWVLGKIALRQGRVEAARAYFESVRSMGEGGQGELQALGEEGLGAALLASDRPGEARDAYRRAVDNVLREAHAIPVHDGRAAYLAYRRPVVQSLALLLLAEDDVRGAFDVLRTYRTEHYRGAQLVAVEHAAEDELQRLRSAWGTLPDPRDVADDTRAAVEAERARIRDAALGLLDAGSAVRPKDSGAAPRRPRPGEVLVGWFDLGDGWAVFAEDAAGVDVSRMAARPTDPDELLASVSGRVLGAERVVLLPAVGSWALPVHAARLGGKRLLERASVTYALELPPPVERDVAGRAAMLVVDPRNDLPYARAEGDRARRALTEQGWSVVVRRHESATRRAFLDALGADFLYFAGHAVAGRGWAGELLLSDGSVDVADVLASPEVPAAVVLNACAALGTSSPEELGIGLAFAARGSTEVVAPIAPVPDAVALAFAEALTEQLGKGAPLSEAYAHAALTVQSGGETAYRMLEP